MPDSLFTESIAEHVWNAKYRLFRHGHAAESSLPDTWSRVALALSAPEPHHRDDWRDRFENALSHFRFLPGGRILAGAGAARRVTLFNCFVLGPIRDAIDAIFSSLGESMVTMQEGGGIGCDFSSLRPAGWLADTCGNIASGPVSFMQVWDCACATLISTGMRRGAMTATLRCDHPDIERFIDAKRDAKHDGQALRHFNLSVLVSDAFMQAVEDDAPWPLMFPLQGKPVPPGAQVCERIWPGASAPQPCLVTRTVAARALWEHMLRAAHAGGDPGVIFIDRVQHADNLWYAEHLSATHPCGEVSLPPHGVCGLGSINLSQFVHDPFGSHPRLDMQAIAGASAVAVRMLDNVYEISHFPLKAQEKIGHAARRIGLGVTGLADAFAMMGVRYGSQASLEIADAAMQTICHAAYRTSIELAHERGAFPAYKATEYLAGDFVLSLPRDILDSIHLNGIRNSHLTAIAPAGSISVLANNVSSGIAPIHALQADRQVRAPDGSVAVMPVHDYAWTLFRKLRGPNAALPASFVEARDVDPLDQLKLQARMQQHVDQSISRSVNLPAHARFEQHRDLCLQAYRLGLKGCAVFRRDGAADSVLPPSGALSAQGQAHGENCIL